MAYEMYVEMDGTLRRRVTLDAIREMFWPVRCRSCGTIYDASGSNIEVVGRYADCDRWKQPCCGVIGDNRPIGWGGTVEQIDKRTGRVRER